MFFNKKALNWLKVTENIIQQKVSISQKMLFFSVHHKIPHSTKILTQQFFIIDEKNKLLLSTKSAY